MFNYNCKLIVGVNSNYSTQKLNDNRPYIMSDSDRRDIISSIKYVDEVYSFNELTPIELIRRINPDYIVKGGDYAHKNICGSEEVKGTIILNLYGNYSTSQILKTINNK